MSAPPSWETVREIHRLRWDLAVRLKARRTDLDLTLREAAAQIGVSTTGLRRMERVMGRDVEIEPLALAAAWLGLEISLRLRQTPPPHCDNHPAPSIRAPKAAPPP